MIPYNQNTPILFAIFNRPDTTALVFEQIRRVQPKRLYIAADGPRTKTEADLCNETRKITDRIDWDCSVKKLLRKDNLGCRKAMIKAISWFFEHEPEGIILEDDCLPSDSFFGFCSALLEKYRNDERIGHIMGSNFQKGNIRGDGSYYFSSLTNVWGWAGWRRVWKDYDPDMKTYPLFKELECIDNLPSYKPFKPIWRDTLKDNYIDSDGWDYQYSYSNIINNRLSIIPNKNLISNIGCNNKPTHNSINHPFADIKLEEIDEIIHPAFLINDTSADILSQQIEYQIFASNDESLAGFQFLQNKLSELTSQVSNLHKIPKIIHQFYEDSTELPEIFTELSETWKKYHPNWEYRLWNKNSIEKFIREYFPNLILVYKEFKYPEQRQKAIRYLLLYQIGGLYIDMDYECIEPLDALLINSTCCLGLESVSTIIRYNKPIIISNALMASISNHPFFKQMIDDTFFDTEKCVNKDKNIGEDMDTFKMTEIYNSYEKKDEITLIPGDLVNPLTLSEVFLLIKGQETSIIENKIEKAYAVRYFVDSWWKP